MIRFLLAYLERRYVLVLLLWSRKSLENDLTGSMLLSIDVVSINKERPHRTRTETCHCCIQQQLLARNGCSIFKMMPSLSVKDLYRCAQLIPKPAIFEQSKPPPNDNKPVISNNNLASASTSENRIFCASLTACIAVIGSTPLATGALWVTASLLDISTAPSLTKEVEAGSAWCSAF